jgi:hypothetical protein
MFLGIFPAQIAAEDENSLVMNSAAELRLPFNVNDASPSQEGFAGNA